MTKTIHNNKEIVEKNIPILCFDTCSLLDIIRDPTRNDSSHTTGKFAKKLLNLSDEDKITFIIVEQVKIELDNHIEKEHAASKVCISGLIKRVRILSIICNTFEVNGDSNIEYMEKQPDKAKEVIENIRQMAYTPNVADSVVRIAHSRMSKSLAPSKLGKESFGDCFIIESIFDLANDLRKRQFNKKIIFVTSNTSDFCHKGSKLHSDLESEFESNKIDFAINLEYAYKLATTD